MTAPLFTKPAKGKLTPVKNPPKTRADSSADVRKALAARELRRIGK